LFDIQINYKHRIGACRGLLCTDARENNGYPAMATRWPKPEHLFFGGILLLMLVGVVLQLTGLAPRTGFWIAVIAFGVAWLPALLALVFIAIPEWWRRGKAG
jgi:hypothetical protein